MAKASRPLPEPAEADQDAFRRTTCYAAGRCQGDLCCPAWENCHRIPGLDDGDRDG